MALVLAAALPVLEIGLRTVLGTGLPGNSSYVQHLALWIGCLGAIVAARSGRHLTLVSRTESWPQGVRAYAGGYVALVSTAVAGGLAWAGVQFVLAELDAPARIGGWLPVWIAEAVIPAGFAGVAVILVARAGAWRERALAVLGLVLAAVIGFAFETLPPVALWIGLAAVILAVLLGAPIFVALGGAALVLFFSQEVPAAAIMVEAYRIVVSPAIPTIPLFTLTGFLLAKGGAGQRLVRLFRALFGWLPGGALIATTLVCAFFTTFTGASGLAILALGGLLLPVLVGSGYPERFSLGLLTSTGSIGFLFPPSLAVILYGVVSHVPIPEMFRAALLPGAVLVGAVCLYGVVVALRAGVPRPGFDPREALGALWAAKWELLLPVWPVLGIFGGFTTLIEAAAITVVYALAVEILVHRDLHPTRDLPGVLVECVTLVSGVFTILIVAMGLSSFMVDAEVPMQAAAWVEARIESRLLFLLALNVFLLAVGCLMDVYSAIAVVVPLLLPVSRIFGIDPLHLGVIFLINLELGYLTPPVGLNLFLAAYRFGKPVAEVCRSTLPFFLVLLGVLLLVTYLPWITVGL
jgi:tripartite ATP-independent transporter DctM subunit